ncbi:MAG TPA: ABC transporter ATP-binding protein [Anaerolineales bacterium]|nr:ABC transporter ATP-binding protein [Anaerolineales bacterium]
MPGELAIRAENLGKRYRIGRTRAGYRTLRDSLVETGAGTLRRLSSLVRRPSSILRRPSSAVGRLSSETIWALREVTFDVRRGQVLGVIGRNGAGKSTLLKLLSRITEPTEGQADIYGRVGSLLEVGTGFHPELTGRENIYLNGAILGMKRVEIDRKFNEIVSFSEVEKFIDTPVKRYSSGMYLRLAFAVAAHLEPEILLVDEVLAVGDAEFQRKCLGKMSDVAQAGRTVLFVSHNMSAILRLTEECLVLEQGRLALRAPSAEAVDQYMTSGMAQEGERSWDGDPRVGAAAPFRPLALRVRDSQGRVSAQVASAAPCAVEFEYALEADVTGLRVGLYLMTSQGEPLFASFDTDDRKAFERHTVRRAGRYLSCCQIPANLLNEGRFVLGVNASSYRIRSYFTEEHALTFTVDGTGAPGSQWPEPRVGPLRPALEWTITEAPR